MRVLKGWSGAAVSTNGDRQSHNTRTDKLNNGNDEQRERVRNDGAAAPALPVICISINELAHCSGLGLLGSIFRGDLFSLTSCSRRFP